MSLNLYKITQNFNNSRIDNIPQAVHAELTKSCLANRARSGQRIAIAVGSRGIANIAEIVKSVVCELKKMGVEPFIIPAMGSHGGATAEGQVKVLNSLGISEESTQAPILSNMDVIQVGTVEDTVPVYLDKNASEADGIFLINRVKPHTDFGGSLGSGLVKMTAIGLGKHRGCVAIHSYGLAEYITKCAQVTFSKANVLGGLAIIENSNEQTSYLEFVPSEELLSREKELLDLAKSQMARLPFRNLDVLVVKNIGKTISGTGMDTNVIGRMKVEGLPEPEELRIKRIVALDLMDNSYGNALGIGLADLTTKRLVDKINLKSMHANVISTGYLERGKIPIYLDNDREAIETALNTIGPVKMDNARVCIIKNTLELEELYVSPALLPELLENSAIKVLQEIGLIPYTSSNQLALF